MVLFNGEWVLRSQDPASGCTHCCWSVVTSRFSYQCIELWNICRYTHTVTHPHTTSVFISPCVRVCVHTCGLQLTLAHSAGTCVCTYTQACVAPHLRFSCIYCISIYAFLYEMKSSISLGSVPKGEWGGWQACNRKLPAL